MIVRHNAPRRHNNNAPVGSLFTAPQGLIHEWLGQKGYTGTYSDRINAFFASKSGLGNATANEHIYTTIVKLGYGGNIQEQLNAFFAAQTNFGGSRVDNEKAFWLNFSLDFTTTPSNAVQDTSGNIVTDTSGNTVLDTQ